VGGALDPAAFADPNPPDERAVRVFDKPGERLFHFVEGGKGVEAIGALADFAGALGSAQQQDD
jgi:hypothetical protein